MNARTAPVQADLFQTPPRRRVRRLVLHRTASLDGARDRAQFVRAAVKEHYDAMRSEASCRSTAKHPTLDAGEKLELLERADFHRTRAECAILALLAHVTYPERAP